MADDMYTIHVQALVDTSAAAQSKFDASLKEVSKGKKVQIEDVSIAPSSLEKLGLQLAGVTKKSLKVRLEADDASLRQYINNLQLAARQQGVVLQNVSVDRALAQKAASNFITDFNTSVRARSASQPLALPVSFSVNSQQMAREVANAARMFAEPMGDRISSAFANMQQQRFAQLMSGMATAATTGAGAIQALVPAINQSSTALVANTGNLGQNITALTNYATTVRNNLRTQEQNTTALTNYATTVRNNLRAQEQTTSALTIYTNAIRLNTGALREQGAQQRNNLVATDGALAKMVSYMFSIMQVIRYLREMINTTIELNSAMTQLKIVTQATDDEYAKYAANIAKTATEIGIATKDLINASTVYARLGYSLDESSALAKFTGMLQNVGDIDASTAQNAITSIVKAFDIDISDIESVMDKLVVVGNNFPISVSQIAEGMMNASSSLHAAGNSLDESIALLTAANTTTQNISKASTAVRTISARLRNTKAELDELGEVVTEAKYQELVDMITGHGVSLVDKQTGELRSTYAVLKDLADIWETIGVNERAALATQIAGVRQQNVFYSILEQFKEAEQAMDAMASSAGALGTAYDIYMESITAHINQLKAAFQALSQTVMDSGAITWFIDYVTKIVKTIDSVISALKELGLFIPLLLTVAKQITSILSAKVLGGIVKAFSAASTFGQVLMVLQGIIIAIGAIKAVYNTLHKDLGERIDAKNDAQQQVDELEQKLSECKQRIEEINRLDSISVVEQDELNNLNTEVGLLEQELAIKQALLEIAKQEVAAEARRQANKTLYGTANNSGVSTGTPGRYSGEYVAPKTVLQSEIDDYKTQRKAWEDTLAYANAHPEDANIDRKISDQAKLLQDAGDVLQERWNEFRDEIENLDPVKDSDLIDSLKAAQTEITLLIGGAKALKSAMDGLFGSDLTSDITKAANAQADLNQKLHDSFHGNVDITNRPLLRAGDLAQYDWNDFSANDNSNVTLHSQTYTAKQFGGKGTESIVVTPVLPDGTVFASQKDLDDYIASLFNSNTGTFDVSRDTKGITLGIFGDADEAKQYALSAHHVNEAFENLWESEAVQRVLEILQEYGYTLDINQLAAAYVTATNKVAAATDKATKSTKSFVDTASKLQNVNKNLTALGKVYNDVKDGGSFDFSNILNNKDFTEAFSGLGDAYEKFIQIVSSSPDDLDKCQEAFNDLTTEYIKQSGALDDLSEETRDATVAMLEQSGVKNAAEIVDRLISLNNALAEAEDEVANKTWQEVLLLYEAAEAGGTTAQAYAQLAFQKAAANSATVQTSSDIANIMNLAEAAYVGVEALRLLSLAKADFAQADTIAAMGSAAAQAQDFETAQSYARIANAVRERGQRYITQAGNVKSTNTFGGIDLDYGGVPNTSGGGGGSSSQDVEEYIADIERFYDAMKRLESAKLAMAAANRKLESSEDLNEKIRVTKEMLDLYNAQSEAVSDLIDVRKQSIETEAAGLRALGFEIEYNNKTNELYVANLEHINELTADSVGEYDSLEEATNELRKETEKLLDKLDEWNEANQESVEELHDLSQSLKEARQSIVDFYDEIVEKANDVVDGFQNVYKVLTDAAKEYAQTGYLSVDSLQSILDLGPKYLAMLVDENGQLVINEANLQAVIAAKTQDMAAETALSYAKQVLLATERGEEDVLRNLTDVTGAASSATWDLAFATVGLAKAIGTANGISEEYYDNAVSYLTSMQSLTETAVSTIPQYYETLKSSYISQADALDQVLKLTQDMLKWENQQAIDALNKQKDAYADIINQKKELLKLTKEEQDHEKDLAEKIAEIAKLQARIDQLSLDDSREAQAQKRKLEEELAKLQKDLADDQSDYALETQEDALDKQLEMYEDEKDDEIAALEDSLNSAEKLYQAALHELETDYNGTIERLKEWNYECGNTLQQSLLDAIDAATAALDRFGGSFKAALEGVDSYTNLGTNNTSGATTASSANDIIKTMRANSLAWWTASSDQRDVLTANQDTLAEQYRKLSGDQIYKQYGKWYHANGEKLYNLSDTEIAKAVVSKMKQNSAAWFNANETARAEIDAEQQELARRLGVLLNTSITRDASGTWWINGKKLYDVYHSGGIVGRGSFKQNEVMALLEKGEAVLDDEKQKAMYKAVDFVSTLAEKVGNAVDVGRLFGGVSPAAAGAGYASLFGRGAGVNGSLLGCNIERIDIVAPIQVVQKLDSEELKAHADMIGALSAQYIREGFTKRGVGANVTAL